MVDLAKLAGQGRAYSGSRAWEPEELDAVIMLENERGIGRLRAADFVRNGISTLEAYDKALTAGYEPKTLNQAEVDVEAVLKDNEFAVKTLEAEDAPVVKAPVEEAPPEETPTEVPAEDAPVEEAPPEETPKKGKK